MECQPDGESMYGSMSCFELTKRIGQGQFATVYKATCVHAPEQKAVALKQVKIFEMMDEKARADCVQEIELLKQCNHDNIIRYLGSFIENNELIIVLELADAGDLTGILRYYKKHRRLLPEKVICKYFVQVCAALDHMHDRRVMHRDIKPDNVFITIDGVVKLGDLGLGRYMSSCTNVAHSVLGTPYYMAPERMSEDGYDFKSDIWSMGCLLYEMAALQPPFYGQANLYELCKIIEKCEYPAIPDTLYSPELVELVQQCIVLDVNARPDMKHVHQVAYQMHQMHQMRQMPQANAHQAPASVYAVTQGAEVQAAPAEVQVAHYPNHHQHQHQHQQTAVAMR